MTAVQALTYDAVLGGRDVLCQARTGTGKTLAFLVPAAERLLRIGSEYRPGGERGFRD